MTCCALYPTVDTHCAEGHCIVRSSFIQALLEGFSVISRVVKRTRNEHHTVYLHQGQCVLYPHRGKELLAIALTKYSVAGSSTCGFPG